MKKDEKIKPKIEFKKLEKSRPIKNGQEVRVTKMNHIVDVLSLAVEPTALYKIKKIDKEHYLDLETGKVYEYELNENRGQNIIGLKETFKTIRNLINNNFTGSSNELFVTLTYAENMTDLKKLYEDFKYFIKKLKRKYNDLDYLSIVEPQARGAWHCHVLLRFNGLDEIYLENNEEVWPMWGHGFTKTKKLKNVDNVGAYLNAYLTDVEVCDENSEIIFNSAKTSSGELKCEMFEKDVDEGGRTVKKKYIKGARLHLYPTGMQIYRCSRGIKKPETELMKYREAKKIVGLRQANYSRTIELTADSRPVNTITYEQYNLKRL